MASKKRFKDFSDEEKNVIAEALIRFHEIIDLDDFYDDEEKVEMVRLATKLTHEVGRC